MKLEAEKMSGRFTSLRQNWRTPELLYQKLNDEFHFDLDPCDDSIIEGRWLDWDHKNLFINPPYNNIKSWLEFGLCSKANWLVYLLPVRTSVGWFHDLVLPNAYEIRFVKKRLRFDDQKQNAPFDSMIVIFKKPYNEI